MDRRLTAAVLVVTMLAVQGCAVESEKNGRRKGREFTVTAEEDIPEEMWEDIEKSKEEPFWITYGDGEWLYIGQGYGKQEMQGYEVAAEKLEETDTFLYVTMRLDGPPAGEDVEETESFPFLVIRTEWSEKPVLFE